MSKPIELLINNLQSIEHNTPLTDEAACELNYDHPLEGFYFNQDDFTLSVGCPETALDSVVFESKNGYLSNFRSWYTEIQDAEPVDSANCLEIFKTMDGMSFNSESNVFKITNYEDLVMSILKYLRDSV